MGTFPMGIPSIPMGIYVNYIDIEATQVYLATHNPSTY